MSLIRESRSIPLFLACVTYLVEVRVRVRVRVEVRVACRELGVGLGL